MLCNERLTVSTLCHQCVGTTRLINQFTFIYLFIFFMRNLIFMKMETFYLHVKRVSH